MTLLAVPNISEGRDPAAIARCVDVVTSSGAAVLDVHTDGIHNRSVLTLTAETPVLIEACVRLAVAAAAIDLRTQTGTHPRLGGLDVCPFVPHGGASIDDAVEAARAAARRIGDEAGVPVFLYGLASAGDDRVELPALRRGGLEGLARRLREGLRPDHGPPDIDPARGVVCVGARGPLIAFNVWLEASEEDARAIASQIRTRSVRALGMRMDDDVAQVSMNLVDPSDTGIEAAFGAVSAGAEARGVKVCATEIVGLVEERFLPGPETTAARLLMEPGRSVEAALTRVTRDR